MTQDEGLAFEEKEVLFCHLLRCEDVLRVAVGKFNREHFKPTENYLALVWEVVTNFFNTNKRIIPRAFLEADIIARLEKAPDFLTEEESQTLWAFIESTYGQPEADLCPDIVVKTYLQRFIDHRVWKAEIKAVMQESPGPKMMETMASLYTNTRVSSATSFDVFSTADDIVKPVNPPRVPTGCRIFDLICGGGAADKEVVGILGPTGGGKTLLAVDVLISIATSKRHGMYFTYEQPAVPDIRDRMWVTSTRVHKDKICRIGFDKMEEGVRAAIKEKQELLAPYVHVYDMRDNIKNTGFDGMAEIDRHVRDACKAGMHPSIVVIDWMLFAVQRYMSKHCPAGEDMTYSVSKQFLTEMPGIAQTYNTTVLVLNQLSGEAGSRGAGARLTSYDAMGCKAFGTLLDFCLVIGAKDDDNVVRVVGTKTRDSAPASVVAKLEGEYGRLRELGDEYVPVVNNRDGTRSYVNRNTLGDVAEVGLPGSF